MHMVTCKHGLPGLLILLVPGRDATCILRSNSTLAADPPGHSLIPLRLLGPWMDLWLGLCLYLVQRGWEPKWKLNLGRVGGKGAVHGLGAGLGQLGLCPGILGLPPGNLDFLSPGGRSCIPGMLMRTHICAAHMSAEGS